MKLLAALGVAVRDKRKSLGMSQEQLAEMAELHRNFISLVERGHTAIAVDSLQAVARVLGTTGSALLAIAERENGASPER
jgi:transcriptional regulator with XRE-family HTH domain